MARDTNAPARARTRTPLARASTLAALAALLACGGGGDDATGPDGGTSATGSFSATVRGGVTASISGGQASFYATPLGTTILTLSGGNYSILLNHRGARPTVGAHAVRSTAASWAAGDFIGSSGHMAPGSGAVELWTTASGTVTVTSSSSSRLEGTFTITWDGLTAPASGTQAIMDGRFTAVCLQTTPQGCA
jgi:hypothetical protein